MRGVLACVAWVWVSSAAVAQFSNLGRPFVRNFDKQVYAGGLQSWGFAQDPRGNLLVANNDGLLAFDGEAWTTYPLPNRTIVRSVAYDEAAGRIYVGGQDAFGYFAPDGAGQLAYTDLRARIAAPYREFGDVWQTVRVGGEAGTVLFQSSDRVYAVGPGDSVGVHPRAAPVMHLGAAGGRVYVQEYGAGLYVRGGAATGDGDDGGGFAPVSGGELLDGCSVTALAEGPGGAAYVSTLGCGLFELRGDTLRPFAIAQQGFLLAQRTQHACALPGGRLALGTAAAGVLVVDVAARRIEQWLRRGNGLQSNNVRAVFADAAGNLWVGLDGGIDHVDFRSPYRLVVPDGDLEGASYATVTHGGRLYVGTSNGLYAAPVRDFYDPLAGGGDTPAGGSASPFALVPGTAGQVWGLDTVYGDLLLGHHEGAFAVRAGEGVTRLHDQLGYWAFLPWRERARGEVLAGTYDGLQVLRKRTTARTAPAADPYATEGNAAGFGESSRILAYEPPGRAVWVAQPYRGIYRVTLSDDASEATAERYGVAEGLGAEVGNHVFAVRGEIVVGGAAGIYRYDAAADRFAPHEAYEAVLGERTALVRLAEGGDGSGGSDGGGGAGDVEYLWYVTDDDVGRLEVRRRGLGQDIARRSYAAIRPLMLGGFEFVRPYGPGLAFVGAERGLLLVDLDAAPPSAPPAVQVTGLYLASGPEDTLVYSGRFGAAATAPPELRFGHRANAFRVVYAATAFGQLERVEYQTLLEGLDEAAVPSEWTAKAEREFTNLPPGRYTFRVRARRVGEAAFGEAAVRFAIAPPWYGSAVAKTVYALLALVGLALLYYLPRRRYAREVAELETEQAEQARALEGEVEARERTIEELRTQQLETELASRHRELADATMHLVQKSELLQGLRQNLLKLSEQATQPAVRKGLRSTVKLLDADENLDADWEQFAVHFDEVHDGFFRRLQEAYPQLTPKDHKLCAYLRMNLSTKEIAPLLNISVRGVEISRYRLRKKLGLASGEDLGRWMIGF